MERQQPRRSHVNACRIALVALVVVTFGRLTTAEFVRWDDRYTLQLNPRLNPPTWTNLANYWREWRTGEFGLYMPVTQTLWSGLAAIGRLDQPDVAGATLNPWVF